MTDPLHNSLKSVTDQDLLLQQKIRVIGIGSHQAADQAGWLACNMLQLTIMPKQIDWQLCLTPALLPQLVEDCDAVVIIDALLSNDPPGQVICLSWPLTYAAYPSLCSSHALGVIEALQLASALQQLPSQTFLLGITTPNQHLDATMLVSKALPQLQHALYQIVDHIVSQAYDKQ